MNWKSNGERLQELFDHAGQLVGHVVRNSRGKYAAWHGPRRLAEFDTLTKAKRLVEVAAAVPAKRTR